MGPMDSVMRSTCYIGIYAGLVDPEITGFQHLTPYLDDHILLLNARQPGIRLSRN